MLKITKKVSKPKVSESSIQSTILQYLKIKKIFHYRQNTGNMKVENRFFRSTSINGLPDIVCVIEGLYIGLEVKTESGRLNENQIETHRKIIGAGGLVYVVRSLKDVQSIFEGKK